MDYAPTNNLNLMKEVGTHLMVETASSVWAFTLIGLMTRKSRIYPFRDETEAVWSFTTNSRKYHTASLGLTTVWLKDSARTLYFGAVELDSESGEYRRTDRSDGVLDFQSGVILTEWLNGDRYDWPALI